MAITIVMASSILLIMIAATIIIETPIILLFRLKLKVSYIAYVNALTNASMNAVYMTLLYLGRFRNTVYNDIATSWFTIAELLLIPISEAILFSKVSDVSRKRIVIACYVANIVSALAGVWFNYILMTKVL